MFQRRFKRVLPLVSLVLIAKLSVPCNGFQLLMPFGTCPAPPIFPSHLKAEVAEISVIPDAVTSTAKTSKDKGLQKRKKNTKKLKSKNNGKTNETTLGLKRKSTGKGKKKKKTRKTFKARRPLKELKLGAVIDGTVVEIKEYGAFIQTKYQIKDKGWALLHKSQIQHNFVEDINKILKVGQKIRSRVISINKDTTEVAVSLRPQRTPRSSLKDISVGDEFEGKVKSIASYGAFVDVGCRSDALLHISRISFDKITNITDYINVGDKVNVHIIDVDDNKKTMAASMLLTVADEYLDRRKKYKESFLRELEASNSDLLKVSGASGDKDDM